MKKIVWSLLGILSAAVVCSAQNTTLYFPQIADGAQGGGIVWVTGLGITNPAPPGSPAVNVTIAFTQDSGGPLNTTLVNDQGVLIGSGSSFNFQIAGGQSKFV